MTNQEILTKAIEKAMQSGQISAEELIFNHDFAKALWPGWDLTPENAKLIGKPPRPVFHRYLQEMVIADDPIKYLGEHL